MTSKPLAAAGAQIAVLAVLGGGIAGCSDTEQPPPPAADSTASAPVDGGTADGDPGGSEAGDPGATVPASLPYTEERDGQRFTVESSGTSAPENSQLWEVEAGLDVVYVQVRVENVDAEPWEFSLAQFYLFDGAGGEHATTFYNLEVGEVPEARTLAVGDSVEGYVPFEVPAGSTGLRLHYIVDLRVGVEITVPLN
jgi:hypothetical protein